MHGEHATRLPLDVRENASNFLLGGDGGCRSDGIGPLRIFPDGQFIGTGLNKFGQALPQPTRSELPKLDASLLLDIPDSLGKLLHGTGPAFGMSAHQAARVRRWLSGREVQQLTIRVIATPFGVGFQVRDDARGEVFDVNTSCVGTPKPQDLGELQREGGVSV